MKGNKMSAILAILLMLSGALFVPRTFAQAPAAEVRCEPLSISWEYNNPHVPGDTFMIYIDVVNVTRLFSFQVGFYYNQSYMKCLSVVEGGFLSNNGQDMLLSFPGSIATPGVVTSYGWSLTDTAKAKSCGVGEARHLVNVTMQLLMFWPPYTGNSPGEPVVMCDLTDANGDQCELILMYNDGVTEITPAPENIHDGYFTMYVVPKNPIAAFTFSPVPGYVGEVVYFDAGTSTKGWNGYAWVDIVDYGWDWDGDCTIDEHTPNPTIDHTFAAPGTYTVGLVVTDAEGRESTKTINPVTIIERPLGPSIDLQNQRWRYIDPSFYVDPFFGEGPHFPGDLFRPGDWVQMFAYTSYNGDPVQHQLVAFEVRDNQGNIVVTGTAITNASGWALYEFRIPWPCYGPEAEFGTWHEIAKWSIGWMGGIPYMTTINDTKDFKVGWGLTILSVSTDKPEYFKKELVVVKVSVQNEYMIPMQGTLTVSIYDDLGVPIDSPAILYDYWFPPGPWCHPTITNITMTGIHLEKWAYVGIGTAKANLFTKLPFLCGTSWCPEMTCTFIIKKTP